MTVSKPRWIIFVLGVAVAASIACGNGSGSLSPTGPSGRGSSAVITGRVNGMSSLPVIAESTSFAPRAVTSLRVTIKGTEISSTVDGSGQFTLNGVPPGTVTLQFSGSGVSASITLSGVTAGDQIHIEITLTNGGGAHVDSETRDRDNNDGREVEGRITAINASTRTITVGSTVVNVPADARIHGDARTLTFADLKVGVQVEVHGAMDGTTFKATDVAVSGGSDAGHD